MKPSSERRFPRIPLAKADAGASPGDAAILDETDTVPAGHSGFTAEELDFIMNYDIKYRFGRSAGGEENS